MPCFRIERPCLERGQATADEQLLACTLNSFLEAYGRSGRALSLWAAKLQRKARILPSGLRGPQVLSLLFGLHEQLPAWSRAISRRPARRRLFFSHQVLSSRFASLPSEARLEAVEQAASWKAAARLEKNGQAVQQRGSFLLTRVCSWLAL